MGEASLWRQRAAVTGRPPQALYRARGASRLVHWLSQCGLRGAALRDRNGASISGGPRARLDR